MASAPSDETKPNRNDKRRQRTHEAILNAADRVFRRKGVDGTSVNDITEEADVAYGSFYNHFKAMDEVVAAVAEVSISRAAEKTGEITSLADRVELLPCIGARVTLRILSQDPAIRWLLERPYIFVSEFKKMAGDFMLHAEKDAVAKGILRPVGGHQSWLSTFPWVLISELNETILSGDIAAHEDRMALISMRYLGIDDALAQILLERSREVVKLGGLAEVSPTAKVAKGRRKAS